MNDKTPNNNQGQNPNGGQRKHNKKRHYHRNHNKNQHGASANSNANAQSPNNAEGSNNKKRPHHQHNHNRGPRPERSQGFNLDKVYEKYLNLLDQHLIARRKYHDLYFRADPNQKAKLERNFYNSLNEVQEFQNKMTPEVREQFNKRNNGLREDRIYTDNHQLNPVGTLEVVNEEDVEDPHYLQSQSNCDYSNDTEESSGTIDDYLKYKGL